MIKYASFFAVALILALAVPRKTVTTSGSWKLDPGHSDAQLSTDGTTDFGKTKLTFVMAFARLNGTVKLSESADSAFDFRMYPASSMAPPIDEEGKVKIEWFSNHANNTLVCFHSKGTRQLADGRLQTTGNLVLTRVDRNVEVTPSESYAGPIYGPPMIHRVTREATFVFDPPSAAGAAFQTTGTTKVITEDFPQLLKAVVGTYWPPLVEDKHCTVEGVGEAYAGSHCTGTFLEAPGLPEAPRSIGEDYPAPSVSGFSAMVGQQLNIVVHMRLTPTGSQATGD
jgi:polyisoprenoid-binding protein YceI